MPEFTSLTLEDLIGKSVLVGISYEDDQGNVTHRCEVFGHVQPSPDGLLHITLADTGEDFTLPPDPEAFVPAARGRYTLRSTGAVVVDPDYTACWTVVAPPPEADESDG